MSALAAYKDTPPNMTYIWNKKKLYADAIKKLNRSDSLLVVPINSIDKMDATKTTPSLVYLCSVDSIFIFDLIALKENGITKEMSDIIKSNKIKFVFSKPITFNRLGIDNWHNIPNVLDFEASGEKFSPFDNDGNQEEAGANPPSTEFVSLECILICLPHFLNF